MLVNQNVFVAILKSRIKYLECQKITAERILLVSPTSDYDGRIRDLFELIKLIESFPNFENKFMGKLFLETFDELYPDQRELVQVVNDEIADGAVVFSDREVEVLECFAKAWVDGDDHSLYGNLSYQDAIGVMGKLKVDSSVFEQYLVDLEGIGD